MITKSNKRTDIQALRALAIIAVVFIHTCPPGLNQVFIRPFINFSVALFLFLSGVLTKLEYSNWPSFFKKRIHRIIIPYVIWTIIYTLLFTGSLKSILMELLTARAAFPFYYIFVYIQFVLLTPLLGKAARSRYRYAVFLVTPVSMLLIRYPYVINGSEMNQVINKMWTLGCLSWVTFYYLGLLLGNHIIDVKYSKRFICVTLAVSIILQIVEGYLWMLQGILNVGTQSKLTSLITSSLFLMLVHVLIKEKRINTQIKAFTLIGNYSFGIYLIHPMIINLLSEYNLIAYKHLPYIAKAAAILIICLLICHICNLLLPPKVNRWLGFC